MRMFASQHAAAQRHASPERFSADKSVPTTPTPASSSKQAGRDFSQIPAHGKGGAAIGRTLLAEPLQRLAAMAAQSVPQRKSAGGGQVSSMPHPLRTGMESMSGIDLSDVRVHRNSPKPAQVNALAFTQGRDIHLAPGQEQHLPHEAWHVVQQKQGRVNPTTRERGVAINDDAGLEREADRMGERAANLRSGMPATAAGGAAPHQEGVAQRKVQITGLDEPKRKNFLSKINEGSVLKFEMDATGFLKQADAAKTSTEVYSKEMVAAIADAQTVILRLISKSDTNFIDSFATGEVDYDDMKSLPFNLFRSWLLHFVTERLALAGYEANKATASSADFATAHQKGHEAQERQMKEWFPKKTIKYISEGFDAASKVVDGAGNGSIDYVFDFTDVKHVFKQPIVANVTKENIISSKIIIVR